MRAIQKYSRSINSSNLRDDEHNHSTEILAAAAMAERTAKLGTLLFRVKYCNDATTYSALFAGWMGIVETKAGVRQWPSDVSASKVARISLDYWLNDLCTVCGGMGHEPLEHVPQVLHDEPCSCCHGTAKRPIEARHDTVKYVTEMVEVLEAMIIHAGGETMRKLASDMDGL